MRLGRVRADPRPNGARLDEHTLRRDGRRDSIARLLETDKERVPLGIDLASMMGREYLPQDAAVLRAQVTIRRAVAA